METAIKLPVFQTIQAAWHQVKGTKATLWAAIALSLLTAMGFGVAERFLQTLLQGASKAAVVVPPSTTITVTAVTMIMRLIANIVVTLLDMGLIYIAIQKVFGLPFNFKMLFRAFAKDRILWAFGVIILLQLMVVLPTTILIAAGSYVSQHYGTNLAQLLASLLFFVAIIFGLYYSVRLSMAIGVVMNEGFNAWQAIKISYKATQGNFWRLVGLQVTVLLIVLLSIIPLGIGLIWIIPFAFLCYGVVYKKLVGYAT